MLNQSVTSHIKERLEFCVKLNYMHENNPQKKKKNQFLLLSLKLPSSGEIECF